MKKINKNSNSQGSDLSAMPSIYYEKFFAQFKEIETLKVSNWKYVHLIGYFCKLYEAKYNTKYIFKFNKAPSSCYEMFQMKRLAAMLSIDPVVIKDFIDWVFTYKVTNKTKFKVIGLMVNQEFVYDFKAAQKRNSQITRTTALPPPILQILEDLEIKNVHTYGDLAFLKQAVEGGDDGYGPIFQKLDAIGFDITCLEQVR